MPVQFEKGVFGKQLTQAAKAKYIAKLYGDRTASNPVLPETSMLLEVAGPSRPTAPPAAAVQLPARPAVPPAFPGQPSGRNALDRVLPPQGIVLASEGFPWSTRLFCAVLLWIHTVGRLSLSNRHSDLVEL